MTGCHLDCCSACAGPVVVQPFRPHSSDLPVMPNSTKAWFAAVAMGTYEWDFEVRWLPLVQCWTLQLAHFLGLHFSVLYSQAEGLLTLKQSGMPLLPVLVGSWAERPQKKANYDVHQASVLPIGYRLG